MAISYKDAGVDVTRGYKAIDLMKKHVRSTYGENVVFNEEGYGGYYSLKNYAALRDALLVAGTDGVGTKLKYAFITDRHDTIGIDCVAMCANDVICKGAAPLIFLDYIAIPRLIPEKVEQIVKGISEGCRQAGCALVGGETAEMPGFYAENEYDTAGFCVGIVDKDRLITGKEVKPGDVLIGLASSGIHSNGYTLVRKLFGETLKEIDVYSPELGGKISDILLTPTRIYVRSILSVYEKINIKALAHITGGGFIEKLPRALPKDIGCKIDTKSYEVPVLFKMMKKMAGIDDNAAYNTFNMGIGMVAVVDKKDADKTLELFNECGEKAYIIGETCKGQGVRL
jgi:phosphoribosylformylglycinamidine cyclo-ligase